MTMNPLRKPEPRWHESRRVAIGLFMFVGVWVAGMLTGVVPDALEYLIGDYTVTISKVR